MFAGKTGTITVSGDGLGEVIVTIQKLSWKTLEKAAELRTDWAVARQKKLGADLVDVIAKRQAAPVNGDGAAVPETPKEHPYQSYDRDTVIRAGVKSWTAEPKLPAALESLDEETAERLHRAILDLSLPSLDLEAEEQARKNG